MVSFKNYMKISNTDQCRWLSIVGRVTFGILF
ncbi:hypothetical protein Ark11_0840 [Candidatus Ichthyocystis hellenicum]|uniref:Uncharacterized protein n=1 Tax=Candidatus Ichthyocystis hellenicum TaxID=1561003 RepID=A0A0S4M3T8_9BURK|nr:hypothetical protein Ark11_0840 [Candidatus Ichthyocystis hellenicum]